MFQLASCPTKKVSQWYADTFFFFWRALKASQEADVGDPEGGVETGLPPALSSPTPA